MPTLRIWAKWFGCEPDQLWMLPEARKKLGLDKILGLEPAGTEQPVVQAQLPDLKGADPQTCVQLYLEYTKVQGCRPSQNDFETWAPLHGSKLSRANLRKAYPTDKNGRP